ncbi:MAG: transcriptional regulator domain-containing protein [Hyphomicrobiales bacterium]|jgi:hypothetical protein
MESFGDFVLPDCRDAGAYAGTSRLIRLGWAWEFLRRNPRFREEFSVVLDTAAQVGDSDAVIRIRSTTVSQDWGLLFR